MFEFGHGLHYTNFSAKISSPSSETYSISSLVSSSNDTTSQKKWKDLTPFETVEVTVANTGKVTSDFVVLGFLTGSFGPKPYPKKSLVAYKRLHSVEAGGDSKTELELNLASLARVDENGNMVLYPGDYSLVIDNDEKAAWNFTLTGEKLALDSWPKAPEPVEPNNVKY